MSSALEVAYYVHGHGHGHAHRSVPVIRRLLADGHRVTTYGGGDAKHLLDELGAWQTRAPLLPGRRLLFTMPQRVAADIWQLGRASPNVVVSDGDQAALAAARLRRIRSLAVGHELVFTSCELPESARPAALRFRRANGMIPTHAAEHRVAVHFLPIEASRDNTWVARPDGDESLPTTNGGHYLAYFCGGNGTRVVEWLRALGRDVRWFGPGSPEQANAANGSRENFLAQLRGAAGVVGSADSNLLAECVLCGKPVLGLYRSGDKEQELNAALATAANVAMGATFDRVDAELVERFVLRVEAAEFSRISLAEHLRPVSQVVSELLAEMAR
jgi:UDP-N-acetylglucosamine--N-acetylmuramyl-(pentapeptide) pyrophosphoryl-undecaprenol N-acetylglucosamine transferase